jgi:uncharacterized membrane protein
MHALVKWLYLLALIVWVGEVVFFSLVVAPAMFRAFPTADAGRAVGAIFPTYYRLGYLCGTVLVVTSFVLMTTATARMRWGATTALGVLMLAATLYAGLAIQPHATALRPQLHDPATPQAVKDEFTHLHRRAVQLNGVVLVGGVVVSVITATALRP